MGKALVSVVIVTKDRKKDLLECLDSYMQSSYHPLEIIVVDNASKKPLKDWLPDRYPKVKLISSQVNLGAAGGRNLGLLHSRGEYILFTDDDAKANKETVKFLVEAFLIRKMAGIVQPLVYDKQKKNLLQGAGHDINLLTGRVTAWGVYEKDTGQYDGLRKVPLCGCVWMVKRRVFEKIGKYDEEYFIPYEDSDFSFRARKAGFEVLCYSKAKSWHQGRKATFVHPLVEWIGITSPERAFRIARNKIIYISKHAPIFNQFLFFTIFLPFYTVIHSLIIIISKRLDILLRYWEGVFSGIKYALTLEYRKLNEV